MEVTHSVERSTIRVNTRTIKTTNSAQFNDKTTQQKLKHNTAKLLLLLYLLCSTQKRVYISTNQLPKKCKDSSSFKSFNIFKIS